MGEKLEVIRVFLSSPSDVGRERAAVEAAVRRTNELWAAAYGFIFRVTSGDTVPPGQADRAQALINPEVDRADIFIGVLHRRFGTPTGLYQSGTEEEFERAAARAGGGGSQPDVWMYFRAVAEPTDVEDVEQFAKVAAFKKRISGTTKYNSFGTPRGLQEQVEAALAAWLQARPKPSHATAEATEIPSRHDDAVLVAVAGAAVGSATPASVSRDLSLPLSQVEQAIDRLTTDGLLGVGPGGSLHAAASTAGAFLGVMRRLESTEQLKAVLSTDYFGEGLASFLPAIVRERWHVTMLQSDEALLQKLMKTSPTAASYVLLSGDTLAAEQLARRASQVEDKVHALELRDAAGTLVVQHAAARWIHDFFGGRCATSLEGEPLVALLARIKIAAAHATRPAFNSEFVMPIASAPAVPGVEFKAGDPVYAPASFFLTQGSALAGMGEPEMALDKFDKALGADLEPPARAAALNNKALALLAVAVDRSDDRPLWESLDALRQAGALTPGESKIRTNVELVVERIRGLRSRLTESLTRIEERRPDWSEADRDTTQPGSHATSAARMSVDSRATRRPAFLRRLIGAMKQWVPRGRGREESP